MLRPYSTGAARSDAEDDLRLDAGDPHHIAGELPGRPPRALATPLCQSGNTGTAGALGQCRRETIF